MKLKTSVLMGFPAYQQAGRASALLLLFCSIALFTALPVSAINLPRTGQTICYDELGYGTIACTGRGQDADIKAGVIWPDPRFIDNADGTVTDSLTGLMWLKDASLMVTRDPSYDNDGTVNDGAVTWQHALDYVKKLLRRL